MTKTTIIAALALAVLMSEASAQSRSNGDLIRVIKNSESATIKTDKGDTITWAESRLYYDDSGKLIGSTYFDASGRTIRVIIGEPATRRADLYNGTICGFAGPCWNPSEKFGGRPKRRRVIAEKITKLIDERILGSPREGVEPYSSGVYTGANTDGYRDGKLRKWFSHAITL
jgi:hypothetical protein